MPRSELETSLSKFIKTENKIEYSQVFKYAQLSDGAYYLAEQARAFWLMDLISSHQILGKIRNHQIQEWKLKRENISSFHLTCENVQTGQTLASLRTWHKDFPLDQIVLYSVWEDQNFVIMLRSEYRKANDTIHHFEN